jgi:hypothetical protein
MTNQIAIARQKHENADVIASLRKAPSLKKASERNAAHPNPARVTEKWTSDEISHRRYDQQLCTAKRNRTHESAATMALKRSQTDRHRHRYL